MQLKYFALTVHTLSGNKVTLNFEDAVDAVRTLERLYPSREIHSVEKPYYTLWGYLSDDAEKDEYEFFGQWVFIDVHTAPLKDI